VTGARPGTLHLGWRSRPQVARQLRPLLLRRSSGTPMRRSSRTSPASRCCGGAAPPPQLGLRGLV